MPEIIHSLALRDWLIKIGVDPSTSRRVVIDIPHDGAVMIYVERFGDTRMLEIEPPSKLTTAIKITQEGEHA